MLRKGSRSRRLWDSPSIPTERYEPRPCLRVFIARFDRRICLLFVKNGFVVGVHTLNVTAASATHTIDSVQLLTRHHTRCTLNYTAEAGRQAGSEARKERGRMEDGREEAREGGREGEREGGREGGREGMREGGREGGREGERGGMEGGREGARVEWEGEATRWREEAMM